MKWKRRGGRRVIIASDGSDSWAPAKPWPDETLMRALARAHRWRRLLEEGVYSSPLEIAAAEKLDKELLEPAAAADVLGSGYPVGDPRW